MKTLTPTPESKPLPVGWKRDLDTIRAAGHEPVHCSTCDQPGWVHTTDGRSELIQHPRRGFLCRIPAGAV